MARRGGKAASRRARAARKTRRAGQPGTSAASVGPAATSTPATGYDRQAPVPPPRPRPGPVAAIGSSGLGETARAEYHYVARDLRDTGILVLIMAALLVAATVAVNLAGIAPS